MEEKQNATIENEAWQYVVITNSTTDQRLLSMGKNGVYAYTLYHFYATQSAIQKTNKVWITDYFCRKGLHWGRDRMKIAKKILLDENIIEELPQAVKGKEGFQKKYIKIHFLVKTGKEALNHACTETSKRETETNTIDKEVNALDKNINTNIALKKEIDHLINKFKLVNPSYEKLFGNKTQRKAIENLLEKLGPEKLEKLIDFLPSIFGKPYAPRITTPYQLEEKLGDLIAYIKAERSKKPKIGIVR